MKRSIELFLQDILQATTDAEMFIRGMTEKQFYEDRKTQLAVLRCIEVIGEAVKNLPIEFRRVYLYIPWDDIAGMRDVVIHDHFGINFRVVWITAKKDLPFLKKEVSKIIDGLE